MKKLITICAVAGLILAVSGTAGATSWVKYGENPVFVPSTWATSVNKMAVIKEGPDSYKAWYTAYKSGGTIGFNVGYATSTDGLSWTENATPVLSKSSSGEWENFSGAYNRGLYSLSVLNDAGTYRMWYGAGNGTRQIGYATSADGISWTKYNNPGTTTAPYAESDPVLTNSNAWETGDVYYPSVIKDGSSFKMYYAAESDDGKIRICYATSSDGIAWDKPTLNLINYDGSDNNNIVLEPSASGFDKMRVSHPHVIKIKDGSVYRMWYGGYEGVVEGVNTWSIGYATSDDGIVWTKSLDNPMLAASQAWETAATNRENQAPWVIRDGDTYKMWYFGTGSPAWSFGYATAPVPEPGTLALLALGGLTALGATWVRRRRAAR